MKKSKFFQQAGIALVMSFSSATLVADGIATEQISGSSISLSPSVSYDAATLRVSGDNTDVTNAYQSGESISMDLPSMSDGVYYYELELGTNAGATDESASHQSQSAQFRIINGEAIVYGDSEMEAEGENESSTLEALAAASVPSEVGADE